MIKGGSRLGFNRLNRSKRPDPLDSQPRLRPAGAQTNQPSGSAKRRSRGAPPWVTEFNGRSGPERQRRERFLTNESGTNPRGLASGLTPCPRADRACGSELSAGQARSFYARIPRSLKRLFRGNDDYDYQYDFDSEHRTAARITSMSSPPTGPISLLTSDKMHPRRLPPSIGPENGCLF
jgi:hypothetical protein